MVSSAENLLLGRKRGKASSRSKMTAKQKKASKKKAISYSKKQSQENIPQTMDLRHSLVPDLNAVPIPDSNGKDPTPPIESSHEEGYNICMGQDVNAFQVIQKSTQENNSFDKLSSLSDEGNGLSFKTDIYLDNRNFHNFVSMICGLERDGHISPEFRLKFLTWFSLRSTTWHKKVIASFVNILSNDLKQLGEQLVDTFADFVLPKHQVLSLEAAVNI